MGSGDSEKEGRGGGKARPESRGTIFPLQTNPLFTFPLKGVKILTWKVQEETIQVIRRRLVEDDAGVNAIS